MKRDDHRGGKHTGTPSNKQIHDDYNKHWREWVQQQTKDGKPITRESVLKHLEELEKGVGDSRFKKWLSTGVKADHSYSEWKKRTPESRVNWLGEKTQSAKKVADEAEIAMKGARTAEEAAVIMKKCGKALKMLGWAGAAFTVLSNAQQVSAGQIPWEEGVHDTLNPLFTAEESRDMVEYGNNVRDEFIGNMRAKANPRLMDTNRNQPGCQPLPGER